jgi:hypothetical protein
MSMRLAQGMTIASAMLVLFAAQAFLAPAGASASDPASIQLVGNFNGITCDPADPANNMESLGNHVWRILKLIESPSSPDTIFFQFTRDGSWGDAQWGWSGVWGVAAYGWNLPLIAVVLSSSGYYYFYFNDSDYTYRMDRPLGSIFGTVSAEGCPGVPDGATLTLYDEQSNVICTYSSFNDASYRFDGLIEDAYRITARAPGYRDTTITPIVLALNESRNVPVFLKQLVGVLISSALCERVDGAVRITWTTQDFGGYSTFDIYRGYTPVFALAEKRNDAPVTADRVYEFIDRCDDATKDIYYYIVERAAVNPTRYGPLLVKGIAAPAMASLGQNYPNPFNPSTTVPFTVGATGAGKPVTISFYDVTGKLVERFDLGPKPTGDFTFRWNPALNGRSISSGVYYCRLQIDKEIYTRTMILLR